MGANGFFIEEDGSGGATSTSSQGGGTTTTSTTSSTSSTGGAPECMGDTDCPGEITPCAWPECDQGACEIEYAAARAECSEGMVTDGLCNGGGVCQQCLENSDCNTAAMEVCDGGTCVGPSCSNNTPDGEETDIDCGGGTCAACENGDSCLLPRDCQTLVCDGGSNECTWCESENQCPMNYYCSVGFNPISVEDNSCKAKLGPLQPCAVDYQCLSDDCNIVCQ